MIPDLESMDVRNPTIAFELLAKDAHPLQQYREITTNALQAGASEVLWDVDWHTVRTRGVWRLACIDNGEGMTSPDLVRYINTLFVSGRQQGVDGNFGIGAKVTAGARNPAGVVYASWREGSGALVHFRQEGDQWGLERFDHPEGGARPYLTGIDKMRPGVIDDGHGTMVVLLGDDEDRSTITPPEAAPKTMRWLVQYLNRRFFRFPDGVRVRVREWPADHAKWPHDEPIDYSTQQASGTRLRTCNGQQWWLDQNAEASGQVDLDGARAHWWILPEKTSGNEDVYLTRGQSGALFQDELYEVTTGNTHRVRTQNFGILFAAKRIALYLEPTGPVAADLSRNTLRIGGTPLPWEDWAAQFRAKPPEQIARLEAAVRDATDGSDASTVKERVQRYKHLWRVTAWRPTPTGQERASGTAPSGAGDRTETTTGTRGDGTRPVGGTGTTGAGGAGTKRSDYAGLADTDGTPATRVHPDRDLPDIVWVDFDEADDRPADRAAEYVRTSNVIFANRSFRVVQDAITRLAADYGGGEEVQQIAREQVHDWYAQVFVEAVIRSWSFEHQTPWRERDYENLTSPEALTLAALPFTLLEGVLKQGMRIRAGRVAASQ
ncbi:ATP-binding protein [Pseudokineococcus marinus]|uniref:Histidine kinase-, DNA gyrase B-, and HSP90-like ATPase n=1 Tax=Pseudokineococcus marinus TaxID=351215 RepID=A0A849BMM0_9ACTN|nr:ATP-binding protein [Pseudokineococcus marinus]NNH21864.1 hypothetical protein [Pseudokineococcus marinus]